jgi:hypothetical protein
MRKPRHKEVTSSKSRAGKRCMSGTLLQSLPLNPGHLPLSRQGRDQLTSEYPLSTSLFGYRWKSLNLEVTDTPSAVANI